jgi:hypothetical protein
LIGTLSVALLISGAVQADMFNRGNETSIVKGQDEFSALTRNFLQAAMTAAQGTPQQAALSATESTIDYLLPSIGDDAPDWMKRIEFDWQLTENNEPEFEILTVQPLWESDGLQDTFFTQIGYSRYELYGHERDTANLGLGYRRLLLDNTVLVGANAFFDYDFDFNHQRPSVGIEAKWAGLDFGANKYWGISSAHSKDDPDIREQALDGHDLKIKAQVPFVPWARVQGRRYWWDTEQAVNDIKGWELGVELDLIQNLRIDAGVSSDNTMTDRDENEGYISFKFHMPLNRPVALSKQAISSTPWLMRDMTDYRLDKVERENKIIVERRSAGVVITRGN